MRFSKDPKTSQGSFRVIFSGPGKCFSKPPETARIPSERFGIFLGLAHGRHRAVIRGKERGLTKRLEIEPGKTELNNVCACATLWR